MMQLRNIPKSCIKCCSRITSLHRMVFSEFLGKFEVNPSSGLPMQCVVVVIGPCKFDALAFVLFLYQPLIQSVYCVHSVLQSQLCPWTFVCLCLQVTLSCHIQLPLSLHARPTSTNCTEALRVGISWPWKLSVVQPEQASFAQSCSTSKQMIVFPNKRSQKRDREKAGCPQSRCAYFDIDMIWRVCQKSCREFCCNLQTHFSFVALSMALLLQQSESEFRTCVRRTLK